MGFLPIFGKGYTSDETGKDWFIDRSRQVMQDGLCLVRVLTISAGFKISETIRNLPSQMFAPLLEPGRVRDETILLLDPTGLFRRAALRVGQFMGDIPEINRQLGK